MTIDELIERLEDYHDEIGGGKSSSSTWRRAKVRVLLRALGDSELEVAGADAPEPW